MKGLLIKDFKIIMNQKRFLFLYLAIAIILSFSMDSSFLVSYIPMVGMLLILSTISYDFNDEGFSFLMTMPIKPGDYAVGKYVFSILGVTAVWVVSVVLQFASFYIRNLPFSLSETVMVDVSMLALFVLIISFMIPIDIKYSPDKGRIVMFIIFGFVMAFAVAGKGLAEFVSSKLGISLFTGPNPFENLSPVFFVVGLFAICIIASAISMVISIRIMQKREF